MLFKWFNEQRRRAKEASIARLARELVGRQPPDWRAVDIGDTAEGGLDFSIAKAMWLDEIRILKKLAQYGALARIAWKEIVHAGEQSLWAHCLKEHGTKRAGCSAIAQAHVGILPGGDVRLTEHSDYHLGSLLYSLQALRDTGVDEPALMLLLRDTIDESKPPSEAMRDFESGQWPEPAGLRSFRHLPEDDFPLRHELRGFAVNNLGRIAKLMAREGKTCVDYSDSVVQALHDSVPVVRYAAVGALAAMRRSLSTERLCQIAPAVLAVVRTPQYAAHAEQGRALFAQFGLEPREVLAEQIAAWEACQVEKNGSSD